MDLETQASCGMWLALTLCARKRVLTSANATSVHPSNVVVEHLSVVFEDV